MNDAHNNVHTCPGPDCGRIVSNGQLACRRHWYQVPKPLRDRVWAAWRDGEGALTREHMDAVEAAIETMTP
jgi:hypothetical protein